MSQGLFQRFEDVHILDGVRTPMVDSMDAFADTPRRPRYRPSCAPSIDGGQGIALPIENMERE